MAQNYSIKKNTTKQKLNFLLLYNTIPKLHTFLHRGNALYFQQKFEECYQDYEKALELNPDLSEASERLNQFRKAERRKQAKKTEFCRSSVLAKIEKVDEF